MNEIGNKLLSNLGTDYNGFKIAFYKAWPFFAEYVAEIASDIYNSCIQCYYEDYTPVKYLRHNDISGFNLYKANQIKFNDLTQEIQFRIDEDLLLPYKGKVTKEQVMEQIFVKGKRGTGFRSFKPNSTDNSGNKWPINWIARYPNRNSIYGNRWSSNKTTMKEIFNDFVNKISEDFSIILYEKIKEFIK